MVPTVGGNFEIMALLSLKVTPNAKRSEFLNWIEDENGNPLLKIKLAAPPVDGKANKALLIFLAKSFGVPKSSLQLVRGEKNRQKTVEFASLNELELQKHIDLLLE